LKDAGGTTHTMTFREPAAPYSAQYLTGTTSTNIVVTNLSTSYDIGAQVSRAINSASAEGLINIAAGAPSKKGLLKCEESNCGTEADPVAEGELYAAPVGSGPSASIGLTSTTYGTVGNGPAGCSGSGGTFSANGATAAASTVTITAYGHLSTGADYVDIITTDGTLIRAYADASNTTSFVSPTASNVGTFEIAATNALTADELHTLLNSHPKLIATSDVDAVVAITQQRVGHAGNTTVTVTSPDPPGMTKTNFAGGINTYASMSAFVGGFNPAIERQNDINKRIKDDTQYLESFVLFRDIESGSAAQQIVQEGDMSSYAESRGATEEYQEAFGGTRVTSYFAGGVTPNMMIPEPDVFKFNGIIGDAHLDGESRAVPAWKIVTLQGSISSSAPEDTANNQKIPQINIELNYTLDIESNIFEYNPDTLRETVDQTNVFADDQRVILKSSDVMLYIEEVNTDILTENFEIEVFKVLTGSGPDVYDTLERKYFRKASNQIVNGFMRYAAPDTSTQTPPGSAYANIEGSEAPNMFNNFRGVAPVEGLDTNSVEYYFDILMDHRVNQDVACKGAQDFNRSSYYVDIDFDCIEQAGDEALYYDIYGTAVEPEICLD